MPLMRTELLRELIYGIWDMGKVTVSISASGTPGRKMAGREGRPVTCMFSGFCASQAGRRYKNCETNLRSPTFYLAR